MSQITFQPPTENWRLPEPLAVPDGSASAPVPSSQSDELGTSSPNQNYWPWPAKLSDQPPEQTSPNLDIAALQGQIQTIWQHILGSVHTTSAAQRKTIPANVSFRDLGGDSLRSQEILAWIREQYGVKLAARDLMSTTTLDILVTKVASLLTLSETPASPAVQQMILPGLQSHPSGQIAQQALPSQDLKDQAIHTNGPSPIPAQAKHVPPAGPIPATPVQQRFWLLNQLHPGDPAYHVAAAFSIIGSLNIAALSQSLQVLVNRHESLRTHFSAPAGTLLQHIASELILPDLEVIDLTHLPSIDQAHSASQQTTDFARAPFDLEHGPLIRARLLRLESERYIFELVLHHIIFDGWSQGILYSELEQLYAAACQSTSLEDLPQILPPLHVDYSDFAKQFEKSSDRTQEAELAYWREQLHDAPALLELPHDKHPLSPRKTLAGLHQTFCLTKEQTQLITDWNQREGTSLGSLLLAAWAATLTRYCGQNDLVLGLPVVGRNAPEWFNLIGLCINTVVVRLQTCPPVTFRDFVHTAQEKLLEATDNSNVPFDQVVQALAEQRQTQDHNRSLYNVLFAMQDATMFTCQLPGLTVTPFEVETGASLEALTLETWLEGDQVMGRIEYQTDLFSAPFINRLIQHFERILLSGVTTPDCQVIHLPMLSVPEQDILIKRWNQTYAPLPTDTLIQDTVIQHALSRPQATAVVALTAPGAPKLSYGALVKQSAKLAGHLNLIGVTLDTPIALLLDRSIAWVVAELGILLSGGFFLAIDPGQPVERLRNIFRESRPHALVTSREIYESVVTNILAQTPADTQIPQVLCLDADTGELLLEASRMDPAPGSIGSLQDILRPSQDNLAYSVFTSGTTGVPKGVCLTHAGLLNLATWWRKRFRIDQTSHCTCQAGLGFDSSIEEVWSTLSAGACLYLVDEMTSYDPESFQHLILSQGITHVDTPTPLCERLLSLSWPTDTSLQVLITGGDALHTFVPAGIPFDVYNTYGPSESTADATWAPVPTVAEAHAAGISAPTIGWPMDNTQILILDQHRQLVPDGIAGEIYISGIGLAQGYLNQPELTRQKFIPNPFFRASGSAGQQVSTNPRLYPTGDKGYWLKTGEIVFCGRIDHQLEIGGFRIEPGEIESILQHHEAVQAALVLAFDPWESTTPEITTPSGSGSPITQQPMPSSAEKRLVAFVELIADESHAASEAELIAYLVQRVPYYMTPSRIIIIEKFPITASGKFDRKALQRIFHNAVESGDLDEHLIQQELAETTEGRSLTTTAQAPREKLPETGSSRPQQRVAQLSPSAPLSPQTPATLPPGEHQQPIASSTTPDLPALPAKPEGPVWEVLQQLWQEASGPNRRPIPVEANFVINGGSLLATSLISLINSALATQIPLEDFLESGTLRTIWNLLCEQPAAEQQRMILRAENLLALADQVPVSVP